MKKTLLILGVLCIVACVLFLLFALLNRHGYLNVQDGSPELYKKLHTRMNASFYTGLVLAAAAAACFIIRSKL